RSCSVIILILTLDKTRNFLGNMNVCFILDGILILYGIILTVLYCRLRVRRDKHTMIHVKKLFRVLQGLAFNTTDTYETIKMEKKPIV
uniref:Fc receptor, IgE, high affinity I, gamma polypeptide like n=1 Tax=Stegastes partitus TaxID=144197 RepID=A0A3B5BK33_9TELE